MKNNHYGQEKNVHDTKNLFQPFCQSLFAYSHCSSREFFFDRGPRREWNDETQNQVANVFLGEAIVWCVFYPLVCRRGFFMRSLEAPKRRPLKKWIWIIFLRERVSLVASINYFLCQYWLKFFVFKFMQIRWVPSWFFISCFFADCLVGKEIIRVFREKYWR